MVGSGSTWNSMLAWYLSHGRPSGIRMFDHEWSMVVNIGVVDSSYSHINENASLITHQNLAASPRLKITLGSLWDNNSYNQLNIH